MIRYQPTIRCGCPGCGPASVSRQSLFSRLPLHDVRSPGRVQVREDVAPVILSQAFDWPGVLLEAGCNHVAGVERVALAHHYVGMNAGDDPVVMNEVTDGRGTRPITLAPGSIWVLPAGEQATISLDAVFPYIRMTLDPRHLHGLLARSPDDDRPLELRRTYGIATPQLASLLEALVAEADRENPSGLAFVETVTAAIGQQLALLAGVELPRPEQARGGLAPIARRRALELIDAKLDGKLTIQTLAREVGLSTTHFARAFKQTIGHSPHRYLLSLRLQRARHLLDAPGAVLSDIALRTGFADQAHFTRLFKREFGVTPGVVLRSRRR